MSSYPIKQQKEEDECPDCEIKQGLDDEITFEVGKMKTVAIKVDVFESDGTRKKRLTVHCLTGALYVHSNYFKAIFKEDPGVIEIIMPDSFSRTQLGVATHWSVPDEEEIVKFFRYLHGEITADTLLVKLKTQHFGLSMYKMFFYIDHRPGIELTEAVMLSRGPETAPMPFHYMLASQLFNSSALYARALNAFQLRSGRQPRSFSDSEKHIAQSLGFKCLVDLLQFFVFK